MDNKNLLNDETLFDQLSAKDFINLFNKYNNIVTYDFHYNLIQFYIKPQDIKIPAGFIIANSATRLEFHPKNNKIYKYSYFCYYYNNQLFLTKKHIFHKTGKLI